MTNQPKPARYTYVLEVDEKDTVRGYSIFDATQIAPLAPDSVCSRLEEIATLERQLAEMRVQLEHADNRILVLSHDLLERDQQLAALREALETLARAYEYDICEVVYHAHAPARRIYGEDAIAAARVILRKAAGEHA